MNRKCHPWIESDLISIDLFFFKYWSSTRIEHNRTPVTGIYLSRVRAEIINYSPQHCSRRVEVAGSTSSEQYRGRSPRLPWYSDGWPDMHGGKDDRRFCSTTARQRRSLEYQSITRDWNHRAVHDSSDRMFLVRIENSRCSMWQAGWCESLLDAVQATRQDIELVRSYPRSFLRIVAYRTFSVWTKLSMRAMIGTVRGLNWRWMVDHHYSRGRV